MGFPDDHAAEAQIVEDVAEAHVDIDRPNRPMSPSSPVLQK
jgi:hypothetical protein